MPAHLFTVTTPGGLRYTPTLGGRILAMLKFMGAAGADLPTLIDYCYGDDPTGGPRRAADSVEVTIGTLRRSGHPIARIGRRGRYVLSRPPSRSER